MESKKEEKELKLHKDVICNLPSVPDRKLEENIDPNRLSLVRYSEKKWVNHTILHYHFLENRPEWRGAEKQKKAVREAFQEWKDLGIGLEFREMDNATDAEVRIGFERGGSWSYVGRDIIDHVPDPAKRTINFGWDLTTPYGRDTALHEIGHTLGFPHEHQNPNAGIVWNEEKVYDYFGGSPNNWSRDKTFYNIIRKISPDAVEGSNWDKDSIMHYQFNKGLILHPSKYKIRNLVPEPGLSEIDISEAVKFYPGKEEPEILELVPFLSQKMEIEPSEQIDFVIRPSRTRNYTIQSFGDIDTVMVLFEDVNGDSQYVDGDDDSGYNYNSKISVRLLKNKTYYLRTRLYYSSESGNGAVMIW